MKIYTYVNIKKKSCKTHTSPQNAQIDFGPWKAPRTSNYLHPNRPPLQLHNKKNLVLFAIVRTLEIRNFKSVNYHF